MRWSMRVTAALLALLLLTGCWDVRNVRDMNYISAIGFDWKDDQYTIYVQLIDFNSISKNESGLPDRPLTTWMGHGSGRTIDEAVHDLYKTTEKRLFWGQLQAIIYSENMIEKGIEETFDMLNRYQEMRYFVWVYGSIEPIDQLFFVMPSFNMSPLDSIFLDPYVTYRQASYIKPLLLQEVLRQYGEPGNTTILPKLSTTQKGWRTQKEKRSTLAIDGAFFIRHDKDCARMNVKALSGLRWMEEETVRSPIMIEMDNKPVATIMLEKPQVHLKTTVDKPLVDVRVKLKGTISELVQSESIDEMEKLAATAVEKQIRQTFEQGLKQGVDVYNFADLFYRRYGKAWGKDNPLPITDQTLRKLQVEVDIRDTGKTNLRMSR